MERAKNVAAATARGTGFVLGKVAAGMQWIGKTAMEHGNSKQVSQKRKMYLFYFCSQKKLKRPKKGKKGSKITP